MYKKDVNECNNGMTLPGTNNRMIECQILIIFIVHHLINNNKRCTLDVQEIVTIKDCKKMCKYEKTYYSSNNYDKGVFKIITQHEK